MDPQSDRDLRNAIHAKDLSRVIGLLANGADLTTVDHEGMTPLMIAAKVGAPEIIELLLQAGADPSAKNKFGYTVEEVAYWFGEYRMGSYTTESLQIVKMLRKATNLTRRQ